MSGWVSAQNQRWRDSIAVAAVGPVPGVRHRAAYHVAGRGPGAGRLPRHPPRLHALDQVRRRVQHQTLGHRGRRDDPLFRIRRVTRRGAEHHGQRSWDRLLAGLEAGDHDQQVARAWIARPGPAPDLPVPRPGPRRTGGLLTWFTAVAEHQIPELVRVARTLDSRRVELLAYFDPGRGHEWAHRGHQRPDQKGEAGRARLPRLRQLPAPAATALQRHLAHSPLHPDPRASTTLGRVEPLNSIAVEVRRTGTSIARPVRPRPRSLVTIRGCARVRLIPATSRVTVRQVVSCFGARDVTGELQAAQGQMAVPSRPVPCNTRAGVCSACTDRASVRL